ncbi:MAG: SAM-dependent methyltransferase [Cyanobacteria bacterium J06634_5]
MKLFTFFVLESLLSPITLTGYGLVVLWTVSVSQRKNLSITAIAPLSCRWMLHLQGIRLDPVAHQLMQTLPSLNAGLNWAVVGPTLLAMNLSGYTPSVLTVPVPGQENLGNMINTRTLFFDQVLRERVGPLKNAVEQVVILGAGFDTRLFKFCTGRGLSLFEVDQPDTQRVKIQALTKSGIDLSEINFVSVNFNQENWVEKLVSSGFVPGKQTVFLWEGVTYYLTEAVVKQALRAMAEVSGKGSVVSFDFFSQSLVSGSHPWVWLKPGLGILESIGEPFYFGLQENNADQGTHVALSELLASCGFHLDNVQSMGPRNFGGLATAVVA